MMPDKNQQAESDLYSRMKYLTGYRDIHGYFPKDDLETLTDLLCMHIVEVYRQEEKNAR